MEGTDLQVNISAKHRRAIDKVFKPLSPKKDSPDREAPVSLSPPSSSELSACEKAKNMKRITKLITSSEELDVARKIFREAEYEIQSILVKQNLVDFCSTPLYYAKYVIYFGYSIIFFLIFIFKVINFYKLKKQWKKKVDIKIFMILKYYLWNGRFYFKVLKKWFLMKEKKL